MACVVSVASGILWFKEAAFVHQSTLLFSTDKPAVRCPDEDDEVYGLVFGPVCVGLACLQCIIRRHNQR